MSTWKELRFNVNSNEHTIKVVKTNENTCNSMKSGSNPARSTRSAFFILYPSKIEYFALVPDFLEVPLWNLFLCGLVSFFVFELEPFAGCVSSRCIVLNPVVFRCAPFFSVYKLEAPQPTAKKPPCR